MAPLKLANGAITESAMGDFEDHAITVGATAVGRSKQVAAGIEGEARVGIGAIEPLKLARVAMVLLAWAISKTIPLPLRAPADVVPNRSRLESRVTPPKG